MVRILHKYIHMQIKSQTEKTCTSCTFQMQKDLETLEETSSAILNEEDITTLVGRVLKILTDHPGLENGSITIRNRITGKVIESGKPIIVPEKQKEPNFLNRTMPERRNNNKDLAFISVPIKAGREVLGTISADRKKDSEESPDDALKLLTIIAAMLSQAVLLYQARHEENQQLLDENKALQEQIRNRFHPENLVGNSKVMQRVFRMIDKIAATNTTVLILGESGTGKELAAYAIHYHSPRKDKPFIKLNCAALSESIIESELFGYEKGAFSGAFVSRKGRFELADTGTIFLDEIGEISQNIQAKLLRVLQEKEFEKIGGSETLKTDARIIAATNRDLEERVKAGEFREDLYYRLNIMPVTVPPLRERKSDILMLASHFIKKYNAENANHVKRISTPAIDMLMSYHWPGNVRELENCIERAIILTEDDTIHGTNLPPTLQISHFSQDDNQGSLQNQLDALEYEIIIEALKSNHGNLSRAADRLGLTNRQIGLRAGKYNINFKDYRRTNSEESS